MADDAVLVEDLRKSFGTVTALAGVDFAVPTGTILGLSGPERCGQDDGGPHPHDDPAIVTAAGPRCSAST